MKTEPPIERSKVQREVDVTRLTAPGECEVRRRRPVGVPPALGSTRRSKQEWVPAGAAPGAEQRATGGFRPPAPDETNCCLRNGSGPCWWTVRRTDANWIARFAKNSQTTDAP